MDVAQAKEVSLDQLKNAFDRQSMFESKTWQYSPEPWPLSQEQVEELNVIGKACVEFYRAIERLYLTSKQDKSILRNRELKTPWVCDYYERGKPDYLVKHGLQKSIKGQLPSIIRPDLLITEEGFALTELDSVPGGVGLTAYLYSLYEGHFNTVGSAKQMIMGFYESLCRLCPKNPNPLITIVVSEESETYQPELQWIATYLSELGKKVTCAKPDELEFSEESILHNGEKIDIIYRFFELFDLDNIPNSGLIMKAVESNQVTISPPMKSYQEEKLRLGLFHHPTLAEFWKEALTKQAFTVLGKIIPASWVVDATPIPPNGLLIGPQVQGKPIQSWAQLGELSQKERNYILKLSGFHESAWGARSVVVGNDISREEWSDSLQNAEAHWNSNPYVLQDFKKPKKLFHRVYKGKEASKQAGRLRLCPYYAVKADKIELTGALATFCPADKKIIHGMSDAALLPCYLAEKR